MKLKMCNGSQHFRVKEYSTKLNTVTLVLEFIQDRTHAWLHDFTVKYLTQVNPESVKFAKRIEYLKAPYSGDRDPFPYSLI